MIALTPLLVDEPTFLREAGISLRGAGFPHEAVDEVRSGGWLDDLPPRVTEGEQHAHAARKHGLRVMDALRMAVNGDPFYPP
jgi:hypothetical protein